MIGICQDLGVAGFKRMCFLKINYELFVLPTSWCNRRIERDKVDQKACCGIESALDFLAVFYGLSDVEDGQCVCNYEED